MIYYICCAKSSCLSLNITVLPYVALIQLIWALLKSLLTLRGMRMRITFHIHTHTHTRRSLQLINKQNFQLLSSGTNNFFDFHLLR